MPKKNKSEMLIPKLVFAAVGAVICGVFAYTSYFMWDSQQSGEFYKPAFEKDGSLYELPISSYSYAFDRGTNDDQLYLDSPADLGKLIAAAYGNYEFKKTDNPFFAGEIVFPKNDYYETATKYRTPQESYQNFKFYDGDRRLIFEYEPDAPNEYVVRLRPTYPAFSGRKTVIRGKKAYLNATRILRDKLGRSLRTRTDEANKLLILSFE